MHSWKKAVTKPLSFIAHIEAVINEGISENNVELNTFQCWKENTAASDAKTHSILH